MSSDEPTPVAGDGDPFAPAVDPGPADAAAPTSDATAEAPTGATSEPAAVGTVPARWYHLQGRRDRYGPLDLDTMRRLVLSGVIGPATYVWADGMPDWKRARDVPAIAPPPTLRATLPAWEP